jgi:hypothetical protein
VVARSIRPRARPVPISGSLSGTLTDSLMAGMLDMRKDAMKPPKKKSNRALWTKCYPDQHKKLHPERQLSGGVKARSTPEKIRMEIYNAIRKLYLARHPVCECCRLCFGFETEAGGSTSVHHCLGRVGWLLIDVRHWKACCRTCHNWIHKNPAIARNLGLLANSGDWNKQ